MRRLVLASASPRRRELLDAAGVAFDVHAVDVDESRHDGERALAYVERVARLKASVAADRFGDRPVLAADTVVLLGDEVLGKPRDDAEAAAMLRRLAGQRHEVLTAVALAASGSVATAVDRTAVWFEPLTEAEIRDYVATGEPLDKAGAYAIQGRASRFIPRIEGSYTNVVGLPLTTVMRLLRESAYT